ncbi:Uncharacterized protein FWK35_00028845, partial [Aphis craccivora]
GNLKVYSTRSKRRKIKNELDILQEIGVSRTLDEENTYVLGYQEIETHPVSSPINSSQDSLNLIPQNMPINSNMIEILPERISNNTLNSTPLPNNISIKDFLKHWAIQFNIKQNAFDGLLKGLKMHECCSKPTESERSLQCFKNLPSSSRTILETPTNSSNLIRNLKPGIYHHFGLAKGIQMYAPDNVNTIKIAIGIDGLPLSKSSSSQFWLILAYIPNDPSYKTIFPIGIYHGNKKPTDSNDFLLDFVEEVKYLTLNGLVYIVIHLICCDAPAKSFILKVKGHTKVNMSTDEFVFHILNQSLPKEHILLITIISNGLHAPCMFLGVMKKLLFLWVQKGPLNVRLRSTKINNLSSLLLSLNALTTSDDFVRQNRSIQDISRWKATEFRLFLLYSGQVVLKNIISKKCYNNFMSLNIVMIILLSHDFGFLINYARQLLDSFYVSHNIHGLLHLCDDYIQYGPLDNCSAFKFENHMKQLKSYLRRHEKPLQQVINRYHERYADQIFTSNQQLPNVSPIFKNSHNNGLLLNNITGTQYHTIVFNKIKINIKYDKDSFIITKQNGIVKCMNFIYNDNETIIAGKMYKKLTPYFVDPIDSTLLDIFEAQDLSDRLNSWKLLPDLYQCPSHMKY